MNYKDFSTTLNNLIKELFDIDTSEELVIFDEEDNIFYSSLFNIVIIKNKDENDICYISFNDSLNTSMLIRSALILIPFLEENLKIECVLDNCHWIKFNKNGEVVDILSEAQYKKSHKLIKV
ncbi:hypothetical protein GW796_09385 [archaeon]|nr:hypothetical protein [archaeon]NCT58941.1 hypothetical protein [archaeon]